MLKTEAKRAYCAYLTYLRSKYGRLSVLFVVSVLFVTLTGVFSYTRGRSYAVTTSNLNFQARLLSNTGSTVPDGTYNVEFNLYTVASGGSTQWTEDYLNTTTPITVKNGYLSANLGSLTAFPGTINWDQEQWLGMTVRGTGSCAFGACTPTDAEMTPRFKLTAVPYAMKSAVSANVSSSSTSTASTNSSTISVQSGNASGVTSNSGNITIDSGTATGTTGALLFGTTNASALTIGRAGVTSTLQGSVSLTGAGIALAVTNNATIGGTLAVTSNSTFTGLLTANGGVTVATGNTFTNASSTLFTALAITDKPAGGNIGTAAATVDAATTFNVSQTTASQTLTLPSPTVTTAGRIAFVNNVGSTSFTMHGSVVNNGGAASFIWNGTTWVTNLSLNSSVVTSIGVIDSQTRSANGAVITSNTIVLQTADATNVGLVSIGTQTIAGAKTFNTAATFNGGLTVSAGQSLNVTGGNTASRPASPTEGMVYFDTTTKQLLTYANGKWQADRSTATKIVAANNSSQALKDSADYVATGTGDQATINTALTAASGGKVYLAEGTFIDNDRILVPNNTSLIGSGRGTEIQFANLAGVSKNLIENTDTTTGTGVIVRDITINGRSDLNASGTQYGVKFNGMGAGTGNTARQGGQILNVYGKLFRNGVFYIISSSNNILSGNTGFNSQSGIVLDSALYNTVTGNTAQGNSISGINISNGSAYNTISGNVAEGNTNSNITLSASTNNTINGNTVSNSTGNNIELTSSANNNAITSNTSQGSSAAGIYVSASTGNNVTSNTIASNSYGVQLTNVANSNTVTGNTITGTSNYGIYVNSTASIYNTISGNTVIGGVRGIFLSNAGYTSVTGNTIQGPSTYGIVLSSADNNTVTGNRVHDSGASALNDGIYLTGASNNQVNSNLITDTTCTTNCYAINIFDGTSNKNTLSGNRFSGSAANAASINDAGTNTIYSSQQTNSTTSTNSDVSDIRFRGSANSTTAFAIQNAAGTDILTINSTTAGLTLAGNFAQTGANTFSTGTGAISLNGATSVTGTNTLTVGTGATVLGGTLAVTGTQTFTGLGTFNGGLTVATGSTFTNASSTLNTALAISNLATGGNIGTAATTVDVATTFNVNQTTASQNVTLPSPTVTTAGRIAYISNVGSASFTMGSTTVSAGSSANFIWNGTAWVSLTNSAAAGVTTIGVIDSQTKSANGAVISGTTLVLQNADASNVGLVSIGSQTFAGAKTFSSLVTGSAGLTVSGANVNLNASSNFNTNINTGTSTGTTAIGNSLSTTNIVGSTNINTTGSTATAVGSATSALNINGTTTLAAGFSQTGANTFSTGTGAISLNGATSVTGTNTLTVGTGATVLGGTLAVTGTQTFTGLGTFNGGLTVATGNTFTNASSTLLTALAVADKPAGGNIGTAATTVDVATTFNVNQTTASQTLTLPSPTVTTGGRIVYVNNIGSTSFVMGSSTLAAAASATYIWNGTAWTSLTNSSAAGVTTLGAISGTSNANGASITGTTLNLAVADGTNGGVLSAAASAQTIGGVKTFSGAVTVQGLLTASAGTTVSGGAVSLTGNAASSFTTTVGNLTLDTAAILNLGNTTATSITLGRTGITTTNAGALTVSQLLTGSLGATVSGGTISLNATGTSNTTIGNATGTFALASSALNVSTAGALTGVTGITTSGGYTQSGATANTFTGTTTVSGALNATGAGTSLAVTNAATIGTNLTVGSGAGVGVFTNNGSTLNTTLQIADIAAGGAIGTAAATVDVYTSVAVLQTTAGRTLTIPNPTANPTTVFGRTIYIANIGTTSFILGGATINQGTTATLVWSNTDGAATTGESWQFAGADGNGILNQNTADQTANFRISGTGRANTSFTTPLVDSITGALSIGTSTATGITIGGAATTGTISLANGGVANTVQIGNTIGAVTQTINIGNNATASSTTNTVIGSTVGGSLTLQNSATINLNAGTVVGNATTQNLFNTVATTLNVGGAATTVSIGSTTGTLTVNNANQTFGSVAGSGVFTNNGATFNSTLVKTDFATGGSIGTAATTVDIYTSISVAQTTAGQTLTLPTPTASTGYGRIVYLSNVGTTSFIFNGVTISNGSTATLIWSNTNGAASWQFAGADGNGILNQNTISQTANFRISGSGRADTSFLTPTVDVFTAGTLSLGTSTANAISIGKLTVTTTNVGNLTIGSSAGSGTLFTNNGATVNSVLALGNFAAGGSIGTAATTVDIYTSISVAQTTASQTLTIPTPTANTTYGRILYLSNIGTTAFTLLGANLNPGSTGTFVWSNTNGGASWQYAGADGGGIQNQNSADQTANFRISGTGRANTSFITPLVDSITGALSIGTSTATGVTIGNATNNSGITIDSGTGAISIGTGNEARTTSIATGAAVQTVSIGSTNTTSSLTVSAGSGGITLNASRGQFSEVTGTRTLTVQTRTSNVAGSNLLVAAGAAGSGASAFVGGNLTLQGGAAGGTGNANGGNILIQGGAGTGTGVAGYAEIKSPLYSSTTQSFGSSTSVTQSIVDTFSMVVGTATTTGLTLTLPNPTITTAGKAFYISADSASNDFTLLANAGTLSISLRAGSTATMIWTGSVWTAAGADSSTSLQQVYNNTATSPVSIVTTSATKTFLIQAGVGYDSTTLFQVNNGNGASVFNIDTTNNNLALNGGAEVVGSFSTDWTADGVSSALNTTVSRTTTSGEYLSGSAATKVVITPTTANVGVANNTGALATNTTYVISFSVKSSTAWSDLTVAFYRNSGTVDAPCSNYNTQTVSTTSWTRVTCIFATSNNPSNSAAHFLIYQVTSAARTFYIDNLSITSTTASSTARLIVGGPTGQGPTLLTLDQLANSPTTTGLTPYLGSMYYDTTTGTIRCYTSANGSGGAWGGCGSTTLQGSYGASTGGTTPEILLDTTRNGIDIQDANTTVGATQSLLTVRASATSSTLGASYFNVNASGKVGINLQSTSTTPTISYDLSFGEGANRTIGVEARATNAAGRSLTVSGGAAGAGASAFAGGNLILQGGIAAGTGNANGGDIVISGGAGVGTGVQGLVGMSTTAFTASSTISFAASNNLNALLANAVNSYGTVPVNATVSGLTLTVNLPANTTVGRILYITAVSGSNDFTLSLAGTSVTLTLKQNSTATLIYNGTGWTAAGASSSTDLQSAYNNTLTSAGGAEIILNANGNPADGLTIRNNATTPINGALLEVQTGVGSNLFSVNNNAVEYASNGGGESTTYTAWTAASTGALEAVARNTTSPATTVATGVASTSVITTGVAGQGAKNTLNSTLTNSLKYSASFTIRAASNGFSALDVKYSYDGTVANSQYCVAGTPTYSAGTASRSGTTVTGSGTVFTASMVGKIFYFADGTSSVITAFGSTTSLTVADSSTVASQTYGIYSSGFTVNTGSWSRITCTFIAPAGVTVTASNAVMIRQTDTTTRTFYIDNISVNVSANVNHATDGSVDFALTASSWVAFGAGTTMTRNTATIFDTSGSVQVDTTNNTDRGVTNNLTISPSVSTQYLIAFYARLSAGTFNDIRVRYTRDGGTNFVTCVDYNTQTLSTTTWTKITCTLTTDSTTATNPDLIIDQPTAPGSTRTFYIDQLNMTLNNNNSSNVQIGIANKGGPITLLTLDRSANAPIAANNDAYLGSMYYDTTTGRIQCYEADGWGACGAAPDNYVNLNPEYAGAVLNGSGVGTMTSDFCANQSGVLTVNTTLCASGESRNLYKWTSPQASTQTYSIYVTYQLPSTFNGFSSDDTVQLTGRVDDTTNSSISYEMFRSESGIVTACGTATTVTSSNNTWQTLGINGNEATGCGFTTNSANAFVIFKINVLAKNNANAYVSTLSFTSTGR